MAIVQMTAKTLNAIHGWGANPHALQFQAEFDPSIVNVIPKVLPGMVVRLNSAGKYVVGLGTVNCMPLFTFRGSDDLGVADLASGDPAADAGNWVSMLTGKALALPAKGAFELTSTAIVPNTQYPPNTYLGSDLSGANAGLLRPGTLGVDMCCGIVSRGLVNNGYGKTAVAFWPNDYPVYP